MADIFFRDESCQIVGAMFGAYREMGCGFPWPVYQEYVELKLADQKIRFVAQVQMRGVFDRSSE